MLHVNSFIIRDSRFSNMVSLPEHSDQSDDNILLLAVKLIQKKRKKILINLTRSTKSKEKSLL